MTQLENTVERTETAAAEKARTVSLQVMEARVRGKPNTPRRRLRDMRILATFVDAYCREVHPLRQRVVMKGIDVQQITGKPVFLCAECTKLLQHALVKRMHCPRDPKPACKHCPTHCYAPKYRQQIREVMKFSGRHLVMHGRLDFLWHLLF